MTMAQSGKEPQKEIDPALGRRHFIRSSMVSLGVTVQEFLKHRDAQPVSNETTTQIHRTDWLRPPGAVEEVDFLERCTKCSDCLEACPFEAIQKSSIDGTPVIFPDESPCQLCEDFPCIAVCETEALLGVENSDPMRMGLAFVSHKDCTASHGCNACVSKCPTNAIEMDFSDFRVLVKEEQCVGCGMCQQICKAINDRVAIRVIPARILASQA